MSRRITAALAAIAATSIIAGCGSGTTHKAADPYSGFSSHPAAMHKFCSDYDTMQTMSGWTDNQIYQQLKHTGQVNGLSHSTFVAQIRWCYSH